jgi:hypothetical protein
MQMFCTQVTTFDVVCCTIWIKLIVIFRIFCISHCQISHPKPSSDGPWPCSLGQGSHTGRSGRVSKEPTRRKSPMHKGKCPFPNSGRFSVPQQWGSPKAPKSDLPGTSLPLCPYPVVCDGNWQRGLTFHPKDYAVPWGRGQLDICLAVPAVSAAVRQSGVLPADLPGYLLLALVLFVIIINSLERKFTWHDSIISINYYYESILM